MVMEFCARRTMLPRYRGAEMKASPFYRIAAVLLLLFAIGHMLGFRQADPAWHANAVLAAMQSVHFDMMGFTRTYWDLFLAGGFSVGVFFLFSAILSWQLGGLSPASLGQMRFATWAFALCFAAITVLSWMYLFLIPIAFSALITLCLTVAAWLSMKPLPAA